MEHKGNIVKRIRYLPLRISTYYEHVRLGLVVKNLAGKKQIRIPPIVERLIDPAVLEKPKQASPIKPPSAWCSKKANPIWALLAAKDNSVFNKELAA